MRVRRLSDLVQPRLIKPGIEVLEDRWLPSAPGSLSVFGHPSRTPPAVVATGPRQAVPGEDLPDIPVHTAHALRDSANRPRPDSGREASLVWRSEASSTGVSGERDRRDVRISSRGNTADEAK